MDATGREVVAHVDRLALSRSRQAPRLQLFGLGILAFEFFSRIKRFWIWLLREGPQVSPQRPYTPHTARWYRSGTA